MASIARFGATPSGLSFSRTRYRQLLHSDPHHLLAQLLILSSPSRHDRLPRCARNRGLANKATAGTSRCSIRPSATRDIGRGLLQGGARRSFASQEQEGKAQDGVPEDRVQHRNKDRAASDPIPFEVGSAIHDARNARRKQRKRQLPIVRHPASPRSTITGAERVTFERLLSSATSNGAGFAAQTSHGQLNTAQKARGSKVTAGKVHPKIPTVDTSVDFASRFPESLKAMAASTQTVLREQHEASVAAYNRLSALDRAKLKEVERVEALMHKTTTDFGVWKVLKNNVLRFVRQLDLEERRAEDLPDQETSTTSSSSGTEPQPSTNDDAENDSSTSPPNNLAITTAAYPLLLLSALHHLKLHHPKSLLPFTLIPTIKRLGRTSYALGATTSLYNALITLTWQRLADAGLVIELLADMDANSIEFDADTLDAVIDIIEADEKSAQSGVGCTGVLTETEKAERTRGALKGWRGRIQHGMEEAALRLARENMAKAEVLSMRAAEDAQEALQAV